LFVTYSPMEAKHYLLSVKGQKYLFW